MKRKKFIALMLLVTMCNSAVPVYALDKNVDGSTSAGVASQFTDAEDTDHYSNVLVSLPTNLDLAWQDSTGSFHKTAQVSAKGDLDDDWSLRISVEDARYVANNAGVDGNIYFNNDISKLYTLFTASELAASKSTADNRQLDIDVNEFDIKDFGDYRTNVVFNINLGDMYANPSPLSYFLTKLNSDKSLLELRGIANYAKKAPDDTDDIVIPTQLDGLSSDKFVLQATSNCMGQGKSFADICKQTIDSDKVPINPVYAGFISADLTGKRVIFPKAVGTNFSTTGIMGGANVGELTYANSYDGYRSIDYLPNHDLLGRAKTVVLPENIKTIDEFSFVRAGLEYLIVPTGVDTIKAHAFTNSIINHIYLPDTVTTIEDGAFTNVKDLKEFTIPKSMPIFRLDAFDRGTAFSLAKLNIPSTVKKLTLSSNKNFANLKEFTLPDSGGEFIDNHNFDHVAEYFDSRAVIYTPRYDAIMDSIHIGEGWRFQGRNPFFEGKVKEISLGARTSGFTFNLSNRNSEDVVDTDTVIDIASGAHFDSDTFQFGQNGFKAINIKTGAEYESGLKEELTIPADYKITKSGGTVTFSGTRQELEDTGLWTISIHDCKYDTWKCSDGEVIPGIDFEQR